MKEKVILLKYIKKLPNGQWNPDPLSQLDGLHIVDGKPVVLESKAAASKTIDEAFQAIDKKTGLPTRDSEWYVNNVFKPLESLYGKIPEYTLLHSSDVVVKGTKTESELLQKFTEAGYLSTSDHYRMGLNTFYESLENGVAKLTKTINQQAIDICKTLTDQNPP